MGTATDTRRIPGTRSATPAPAAVHTLEQRREKWAATVKALEDAVNSFILSAADCGADFSTVASVLSDRFGAFRYYLAERVVNVRAQLAARR